MIGGGFYARGAWIWRACSPEALLRPRRWRHRRQPLREPTGFGLDLRSSHAAMAFRLFLKGEDAVLPDFVLLDFLFVLHVQGVLGELLIPCIHELPHHFGLRGLFGGVA